MGLTFNMPSNSASGSAYVSERDDDLTFWKSASIAPPAIPPEGVYSLPTVQYAQHPIPTLSTLIGEGSVNNQAPAANLEVAANQGKLSGSAFPPKSVDARFATLLRNEHLHDALAMNSDTEVCANTRPCLNRGLKNKNISYDQNENAFAVKLDKVSLDPRWQIRRYFPELNQDNASSISFQWEFKYSAAYLSTGALHTYKAFQLSSISENLMFELQHRFSRTDETAVALPTIRYYMTTEHSEATDSDPLSTDGPQISSITGEPIDNWQPGGNTAAAYRDAKIRKYKASDHLSSETFHSPYIIRANLWTRVTLEFEWIPVGRAKELRLRMWMSDEETPPTLVIASVKEPGKGFLLSNDASRQSLSFQNWWLEMNSSQRGVLPTPGTVWVKNFIVYKDATIPLE